MHTMPPNTDRPINRAMVVGCAVSATRNHLKLHEPRRLKVLFCNIHAKTRKLWKHSAMRLAAFRTNAAHQPQDMCRLAINDQFEPCQTLVQVCRRYVPQKTTC